MSCGSLLEERLGKEVRDLLDGEGCRQHPAKNTTISKVESKFFQLSLTLQRIRHIRKVIKTHTLWRSLDDNHNSPVSSLVSTMGTGAVIEINVDAQIG